MQKKDSRDKERWLMNEAWRVSTAWICGKAAILTSGIAALEIGQEENGGKKTGSWSSL